MRITLKRATNVSPKLWSSVVCNISKILGEFYRNTLKLNYRNVCIYVKGFGGHYLRNLDARIMLRTAQEGEFFGSFLLKKENFLALSHARRRIFWLFLAQEGELFRMVLEVSSYRGTGYRRTRKTFKRLPVRSDESAILSRAQKKSKMSGWCWFRPNFFVQSEALKILAVLSGPHYTTIHVETR